MSNIIVFQSVILVTSVNVITDTSKPVNWRKPVYELDPSDPDNNGFVNEDFIVWMRTAALPTFRKLYRIIQKKKDNMTPTLPPGNYSLEVIYSILEKRITKMKTQIKMLRFTVFLRSVYCQIHKLPDVSMLKKENILILVFQLQNLTFISKFYLLFLCNYSLSLLAIYEWK